MIRVWFVLCCLAAVSHAQVFGPARKIRHGNTVPGSCNAGEIFHDDDAVAGINVYTCVAGSFVAQGTPAGSGIINFGGLIAATQAISTGTSGTAPNWTTSGGNTHILNIPMAATASVTAGLVSNAQYADFMLKSGSLTQLTTRDYSDLQNIPATFAPSAHNHAVADLNSGTLGFARGGTNQTTWTASRCVQVNAAGTALESASGACGTGGGDVSSVFTRTGAVVATAGDYTAALITNTPAGGIAGATVQAAIDELDTEKQAVDADLTALAALSGTGCIARTAANTYALRSLTSPDSTLTIINGDCVAGSQQAVVNLSVVASRDRVQRGDDLAYVDTGDDDTYAANPLSGTVCQAFVDGMSLRLRVVTANTGPATFNPCALGAKSILRHDGSALQSGDIAVDTFWPMTYHAGSDHFRLPPLGSVGEFDCTDSSVMCLKDDFHKNQAIVGIGWNASVNRTLAGDDIYDSGNVNFSGSTTNEVMNMNVVDGSDSGWIVGLNSLRWRSDIRILWTGTTSQMQFWAGYAASSGAVPNGIFARFTNSSGCTDGNETDSFISIVVRSAGVATVTPTAETFTAGDRITLRFEAIAGSGEVTLSIKKNNGAFSAPVSSGTTNVPTVALFPSIYSRICENEVKGLRVGYWDLKLKH